MVSEMPADALDAVVEIGKAASAAGTVGERAAAILGPLRRITPFRASAVVLADLDRGRLVPLVADGLDPRLVAHVSTEQAAVAVTRLGVTRPGPPMLLRDWPIAADQVRSWTRWCAGTGLTEALTTCLTTADDRSVGVLGLFFDTPGQPTAAAVRLVGQLSVTIANALDPLRGVAGVAGAVPDAVAGILLTRSGDAVALPGLPNHPLLGTGSRVLGLAVEQLAGGSAQASFLIPLRRRGGDDGHARVTAMTCAPQLPYHHAAVVLLSQAGDLRGLTRRELEVLGLVVAGWSNLRIAGGLAVAPRTVSTHLEHIQLKLAVETRQAMAWRALRNGLYIPAACTTLAASAVASL